MSFEHHAHPELCGQPPGSCQQHAVSVQRRIGMQYAARKSLHLTAMRSEHRTAAQHRHPFGMNRQDAQRIGIHHQGQAC